MELKQKGQAAVARIIQIRQFYSKTTNLQAKRQYLDEFKSSILQIVNYLKTQKNMTIVQNLKSKLPDLENQLRNMKAEYLKIEEEQNKKPLNNTNNNKNTNTMNINSKPMQINQFNQIKQIKKQEKKEIEPLNSHQKQISAAIVKQKPNISWDDVAGLDQAKNTLQQAVILPIKHPEIFVGQRTPWKGILLYGPPGTGKTFLAKACATEMKGGTFFSISASDLMSKYVGQSQKTLKALFSIARKQRPSIIFIDQIDSIAGQRSSDENQVSRRVKTQFLIQMQGVGNDCKDVLVLGATNLPWALDSAVRRRFQKRVYIPLPDIKGRLALLKRVIEKNKMQVTKQEMYQLANMTDGYSGSDLSNMVNDALMSPVRQLNSTQTWVQVNDQGIKKYAPFNNLLKRDSNATYFEGNIDQLKAKGYTIHLATTFNDFLLALKNSKPSVSKCDLEKYIKFTKSFGMDG